MVNMPDKPVGRPRSFDRDDALRKAAVLFWQHGFSGTSTRMLTAALAISTSSLYGTFGSKAELFGEAVRTYALRYSAIYDRAVADPSISRAVRRVLTESVDEFVRTDQHHPGCLTSSAVMTDSPATMDVRAYVTELQRSDTARLRARIEEEIRDGGASATTDAAAVTELVQTLWHGLSARADLGAGREELRSAVDVALTLLDRELVHGAPGARHDHPAADAGN